MGIDPGTRIAGYAVVDKVGNRLYVVEYGAAVTGRNDTFPERLKRIHDDLRAVIERCRPDVVALEEVFYGKNVKSAVRIGEGRGVAILCAANAGVPVEEYAATVVKKAVVGRGGAHKSQVQEMVRVILGLREIPQPEDAADALAIAVCHCHRMRPDGRGT